MGYTLTTVLYVLVAYIAVSIVRSRLAERRFQRFAREHGCEEPKRNTLNKLPWGIDGFYRMVNGVRNGKDLLDDIVMQKWQQFGVTTMVGEGFSGFDILETIEPRNLQALLATQFQDFGTGEKRAKQFGALLGKNIFTSDGEFWAHSRSLFRPVFNKESINDLEETERSARILIDVLPQGEDGWTGEVNLMDHFFRFTLDTATAFLFGQTTDSQLAAAGRLSKQKGGVAGLGSDQSFSEAFQVAQEWLSWRIRFQDLYWAVQSPTWWKARDDVRDFVDQYVRLALESSSGAESEAKKSGEKEQYNLLQELATQCRDPVELRDQALGVLAAGRDTTAGLLSWLFCQLATDPQTFTKLRREIINDFGTTSNPNTTTATKDLTFSNLKACRYLRYCIFESLRLCPGVPFNNRQAVTNTTLPVGGGPDGTKAVAVRKGQVVNFSVYVMHRRKDLWGEDAAEFKPERWEGRKIDWSYLPFSGGPRICLGQQYAMTEASFLTVRLLQTFDQIEWLGETGRITKGFTLTMYPAKGVPVRLRRAKD